jgi:hypothetical protein
MDCSLTGVEGPEAEGKGTYVKSRALFVHPRPKVNQPLSWLSLLPWQVSKTLYNTFLVPKLPGNPPRRERKGAAAAAAAAGGTNGAGEEEGAGTRKK